MVYSHNGTLCSNGNEQSISTYNNIDELHIQIVKEADKNIKGKFPFK